MKFVRFHMFHEIQRNLMKCHQFIHDINLKYDDISYTTTTRLLFFTIFKKTENKMKILYLRS